MFKVFGGITWWASALVAVDGVVEIPATFVLPVIFFLKNMFMQYS